MAAAQWLLSRHSHQNETAATVTMEGDYLTTSDPAFHALGGLGAPRTMPWEALALYLGPVEVRIKCA
jgi:hypothetical protein